MGRTAYQPGAYKIRKSGSQSYNIGLPPHVGDKLYDLGLHYIPQIVEGGILLKPLEKINPDNPLPAWAERA
jgi:hypothetical protein